MAEKLLLQADPQAQRQPITGAATRYIDWLFPGVLGMNMMFTCLMGAGYVVVRYRKNGFLKRLSATPVSAFEFLSAQVLSRLGLALAVTLILYHRHRHGHPLPQRRQHRPAAAGRGAGVAESHCLRPDRRRALRQRGSGQWHAEPFDVADDAAVGRLVLAGGLAALDAAARAAVPADPHPAGGPRRSRWTARGRPPSARTSRTWPAPRWCSSASAPSPFAGDRNDPGVRHPRVLQRQHRKRRPRTAGRRWRRQRGPQKAYGDDPWTAAARCGLQRLLWHRRCAPSS